MPGTPRGRARARPWRSPRRRLRPGGWSRTSLAGGGAARWAARAPPARAAAASRGGAGRAWAGPGAGGLERDMRGARAIAALDDAMADAEGMLPDSLVSGETPLEMPGSAPAPGVLQRLYDCLCRAEAAGVTAAGRGT